MLLSMSKLMKKEVIVGDTIYEVLDEIGSGSYGTVSSARIEGSSAVYTIKSISMINEYETMIEQTSIIETSAVRLLDHPNIVKPIGFSLKGDDLHMIMHHEGRSLDRRKLHRDSVKYIMFQLLDALNYMHKSGVVHRDIKTDNILINSHNKPIIIDFGIASVSRSDLEYDQVVSLAWRTPSLITGTITYDIRVDVWALGVVMYNMLTGQRYLFKDIRDESSYILDVASRYEEGRAWAIGIGKTINQVPLLEEKLRNDGLHSEDIDMICSMLKWSYHDIPYPRECLAHTYFNNKNIPFYPTRTPISPYPMISKITRKSRYILFSWISEVCKELKQSRLTLLTTIALFDRYEKVLLHGHKGSIDIPNSKISPTEGIPNEELQVVGEACLYLSIAIVLSNSIDYKDIIDIGAQCYGSCNLPLYVASVYEAVGYQVVSHIPSLSDSYIYSAIHGHVLDTDPYSCMNMDTNDSKDRNNYPSKLY